jgi:hypothetical protein
MRLPWISSRSRCQASQWGYYSKEFWAELSRHIPNWKELDVKVAGMKL